MDKIKIVVTATNAVCVGSPVPLTTGMVGLLAEFTFSSEWDNLTKTAVCVGSGTTKDVLDVKDEIIVPHECLKDTAGHLKIGVYGVNSSGDLVIPTVYAYCGRLLQGADPSGEESADPTLPIWAQLQAMMGDLGNLTTTAKENLVAAINEAAKSGGGGGGTAADVKMQVAGGYIQYSTDGGESWNNLIAMADLIGAKGDDGNDGDDGGYYTPEISQPDENTMRVSFTPSDSSMPEVGSTDVTLPAGKNATVDATLTQSGQAADAAVVGQRFSALSEEMLTEESDPTVPSWAKTAQKPSYTASEVGADPSGTAASQVAAHNTGTDTHSDIRLLIQGLTDRLNALADSDDTTLDQLSEVVAYIKSNRELISAITTDKVSVADIVNNLTTNVTNKPLSAAQGVALKALIDAITIPEALPNPNALTFTGAVTGSYDGSEAMSVEIPSGGGAVSWKLIRTINIVSGTSSYSFNTDNNGNAFKVKNFLILIDTYPSLGYLEIKPNGNFSFVQNPSGKKDYPFSFMMKRVTDGRYILENSNTSNSIFERTISNEYPSFGEFTSFSLWFSVAPGSDTTMHILGEDV